GYAIPISFAKDIIGDLMNKTTKVEVAADQQGYLGIQLQNIDSQMEKSYGMPQGIYVYKIVEGGAAASSDLRERDIITKFDGETVKTGEELQRMMTYYKGGTDVTLTVQSLENGAYVERQVAVKLGYRKDSVNRESDANPQNAQN
ncbi:MAG: PDZ domain-containing protein, partial [Clostridium sp.]